jgi:hypothetical protein
VNFTSTFTFINKEEIRETRKGKEIKNKMKEKGQQRHKG